MPNHKRGGRPPTPTHLKILAGNPGKRDLPANEPEPEPGIPDCPEQFVAAQKAAFEKLGEQLNGVGVLTHLDGRRLKCSPCATRRRWHRPPKWRSTAPAG